MSSDGYLSNANLDRVNTFIKIVQPVTDATDLTLVSNLNKVDQNPPVGATPKQMAQYGTNYAYNTDPGSQGYFGYNNDRITTDYEYIGLNSRVGGWTIDNKIYTYAYFHVGLNGEDVGDALPNGVTAAGGIPNGTAYGADHVPGEELINNYRSVGDILRFSRDLGPGALQFGGWFDHQSNLRALYEVDFSDNSAFNPILAIPPGGVPQAAYTDRLQNNQLFSREAYAQYVWHVFTPLDITAGDKYVDFERVLSSPVNQSTLLPTDYERNWTRDLPSVDAHYKIADNWSAYVQYAKGFLAPNLNTLYVANPENDKLQPEATTNVQAGTTWIGSGLTVSADIYTINFSNLIQKEPGATPNDAYFYNLGGVKYKGAEAEGSYAAGLGFTVYANASYNSARLTTDRTWVAATPSKTAALGLLYNSGPLQGSLIGKYVGRRYGDAEDAYPLGSYVTTDAAVNYLLGSFGSVVKAAKIGVTVQNLANRNSIYFLNGYSNNGSPMYFTLPGRSVQVNLSASF